MTLATADTFGYNHHVLWKYLSVKLYIKYDLREFFVQSFSTATSSRETISIDYHGGTAIHCVSIWHKYLEYR